MVIPQEVLDQGYKKQVHVEGWNKACTFHYLETINGSHHIITPKSKKEFWVRANLLYTNKNLN